MKLPAQMLSLNAPSLRASLKQAANGDQQYVHGRHSSVRLNDLMHGSTLGADIAALDGACVVVLTRDQLTAALCLIELDGIARRLIVCPAEFAREHLPRVMADADVDAIVSDDDTHGIKSFAVRLHVTCRPAIVPNMARQADSRRTEWILFTSGTTGMPKMVVHTLPSLTSAIKPRAQRVGRVIWATFYDIRRYGGLQILLRAVLDGGSVILSDATEPIHEHLARISAHGATHVTGTPSHWRRVLMSPAARAMAPSYVRLSGEIADQAILDNLHVLYPYARVVHAFASTEAGVGFEVDDGLEGVPAGTIEDPGNGVKLKVDNCSLRISSPGNAHRYLGHDVPPLAGHDGFVETNDMVELHGSRYYFVGRRDGVVNVGGLKVYPEEVEAVINRHPAVRMSLVHPLHSSIVGSLVAADVVLQDHHDSDDAHDGLRREIVELCRGRLARHKVPTSIRFVASLTFSASGKLVRRFGPEDARSGKPQSYQ